MAERHEGILAELSQLGLGLARDLQARALATEDPKIAADLALAFQRVARSLRQTLALEARLAREHRHPDMQASLLAEKHARVRRHEAVQVAVQDHILAVAQGPLREELMDELHERLGDEAQDEDFADEAFDDHVARLCADLRLDAVARGEPRYPEDEDEDDGDVFSAGSGFDAAPPDAGPSGAALSAGPGAGLQAAGLSPDSWRSSA